MAQRPKFPSRGNSPNLGPMIAPPPTRFGGAGIQPKTAKLPSVPPPPVIQAKRKTLTAPPTARAVGRASNFARNTGWVVQRASLSSSSNSAATGSSASVGNVAVMMRGPVDSRITTELTEILAAAEAGDGKAREGDQLKKLKAALKDENVAKELPGSRETYGLSGASFVEGSQVVATQGSKSFVTAVESSLKAQFLSVTQRDTGVHDEIAHISAYPGVQALLSTQRHCMFCYGLIHRRGYEHDELRASPWPQVWQHDYLDFKLTQTSPRMDAITSNPIVKLSVKINGKTCTAYYDVADNRK